MFKQLHFAGIMIVFAALASTSNAADDSAIRWEKHFDKAYKANSGKRPMLVFLSVKGCYHCKRMEKTTFVKQEVVSAVNSQFVPIAIDGDDYPALVKHLGITSYPTTLIINSDLKVVSAMAGYLDAEKLRIQLEKATTKVVASKPDSDLR